MRCLPNPELSFSFYFEIGNGLAWSSMIDGNREIVKCRPGPLYRGEEHSFPFFFLRCWPPPILLDTLCSWNAKELLI